MKALDLCCGLGGWAAGFLAEGWEIQGVDIEPLPYPGPLVVADVRALDGRDWRGVDLVIASPPCEAFSRHDQPWCRAKNPPAPDLSIWRACERIAQEAHAPLVLENVRGAQRWTGRALWRWGSCYLWGDGVPVLRMRTRQGNGKARLSGRQRRQRARVPLDLARFIASYHRGW